MKIKELIEELKKYDENLNVYVDGYESGVNDLTSISPIDVALNVNVDSYEGNHQEIFNNDSYVKEQKSRGVLLH